MRRRIEFTQVTRSALRWLAHTEGKLEASDEVVTSRFIPVVQIDKQKQETPWWFTAQSLRRVLVSPRVRRPTGTRPKGHEEARARTADAATTATPTALPWEKKETTYLSAAPTKHHRVCRMPRPRGNGGAREDGRKGGEEARRIVTVRVAPPPKNAETRKRSRTVRGVERNSASRHCRSERNSGIEGKGTKVVERMRTNAAYRRANWGREAQSLRPTSKGNGHGLCKERRGEHGRGRRT